jgi:hypothetical protein
MSRFTHSARVYSTVNAYVDVQITQPGSRTPGVKLTASAGTNWLIDSVGFHLFPPCLKRDGTMLTLEEASYLLRSVQEFLCHPTVEGQLVAEDNIRRLFRRNNINADPPADIDLL